MSHCKKNNHLFPQDPRAAHFAALRTALRAASYATHPAALRATLRPAVPASPLHSAVRGCCFAPGRGSLC